LAQGLGVDGRGELAAATAPLLLAAAGLTLGIPEALTYFIARRIGPRRQVLLSGLVGSAVVGIIGTIAIWLLAPLLSGGDSYVAGLITIVGFTLAPSMIATSTRGFMRGTQLWHLIALDQVTASLFRIAAVLVLLTTGTLSPLTAGLVTGGANFVGLIVYAAAPAALKRRGALPSDSPDEDVHGWPLRRQMASYGLGVWLGAAAGVMLSRLDQVLLISLSTAAVLGLYAVAVSIAEVVRVFNTAVRDVVFSLQSSRHDIDALALASRVSTLFTFIGSVGIAVAAWILVPPLFGEEFRAAVPLIFILLAGTVIGNPGSVVAAGLSARGRPVLRSIAIAIGVAINVIGIYALVPFWGATGAAVASSIANVATGALVIFFAYKFFDMKPGLFLRFRKSDVVYVGAVMRGMLRRKKA
jgi:O-antigen/teichoic acid export membrane protein